MSLLAQLHIHDSPIHEDRSGVAVIITNATYTTVWLGKRRNNYMAGSYGLPGGRIHELDNESSEEAGHRELQEETGLTGQLILCGVVYDYSDSSLFTHHIFVRQTDRKPVRKEPDKCAGWKQYTITKLPHNILPAHQAAIACFLEWITTHQVAERTISTTR